MCFLKLIQVHLLVSELYIYQHARFNNKKIINNNVLNSMDFLSHLVPWCSSTL